jgi:hypothetical protein
MLFMWHLKLNLRSVVNNEYNCISWRNNFTHPVIVYKHNCRIYDSNWQNQALKLRKIHVSKLKALCIFKHTRVICRWTQKYSWTRMLICTCYKMCFLQLQRDMTAFFQRHLAYFHFKYAVQQTVNNRLADVCDAYKRTDSWLPLLIGLIRLISVGHVKKQSEIFKSNVVKTFKNYRKLQLTFTLPTPESTR